jgi:DNA-binding NarL/FixJ family response regulator
MENGSASILVVDDDSNLRTMITELLESVRYRAVGAATGEEALRLARKERPAVVLLDVHLPGLSGYEVCRQIKDEFGEGVAVALLSGKRRESIDRVAGLLIGADDYITKPFAPDELIGRVRRLVARSVPEAIEADLSRLDLDSDLTPRELQVLRLLATGHDQTEIAQRLSISSKTVSTHIQNLLGKLGVHSRAQAIAAAYNAGLVSPSSPEQAAASG